MKNLIERLRGLARDIQYLHGDEDLYKEAGSIARDLEKKRDRLRQAGVLTG